MEDSDFFLVESLVDNLEEDLVSKSRVHQTLLNDVVRDDTFSKWRFILIVQMSQ